MDDSVGSGVFTIKQMVESQGCLRLHYKGKKAADIFIQATVLKPFKEQNDELTKVLGKDISMIIEK